MFPKTLIIINSKALETHTISFTFFEVSRNLLIIILFNAPPSTQYTFRLAFQSLIKFNCPSTLKFSAAD